MLCQDRCLDRRANRTLSRISLASCACLFLSLKLLMRISLLVAHTSVSLSLSSFLRSSIVVISTLYVCSFLSGMEGGRERRNGLVSLLLLWAVYLERNGNGSACCWALQLIIWLQFIDVMCDYKGDQCNCGVGEQRGAG